MSPAPATLALPARRARATGLAGPVGTLWRFGRPHTLIGTTLSVLGLYVVAATQLDGARLGDGLWPDVVCTLLAALCVNVFITGINQITDVEIDRVNKPALPMAAGELSARGAWAIVGVCAVIPVVLALTQGGRELVAVLAGLAVGTAYSVPPVRLKRHATLASLSISGVRGLVVNLGVFAHFSLALTGAVHYPAAVWALTAFILPFALAIAVLKDVPDIEGDRRYRIATFSVRFGAERVVRLAMTGLSAAYAGMALAGVCGLVAGVQPLVWGLTHAAGLGLLWRWRAGVDVGDRDAFTHFYMGIWKLFFLEYAFVAAACLA